MKPAAVQADLYGLRAQAGREILADEMNSCDGHQLGFQLLAENAGSLAAVATGEGPAPQCALHMDAARSSNFRAGAD